MFKTALTENELREEYAKFNEQEKKDYEGFFNCYEDLNSNDPSSSHLEAIIAVISLRKK